MGNINKEDLITEVIYSEYENKFLVRYTSLKEEVYEELNLFDDTYEKIIELVIKQYGKSFEELEQMGIIKYKRIGKLQKVIKNHKIKKLITRKRLVSLVLAGTLIITYFGISDLKSKKNTTIKNKQNYTTLDNSITPSPNKPLERLETLEASKLPSIEATRIITQEPTTTPTLVPTEEPISTITKEPVATLESILTKETTIKPSEEATFAPSPTEVIKQDLQEDVQLEIIKIKEPIISMPHELTQKPIEIPIPESTSIPTLEPIVYIYNTHSNETYATLNETVPTVKDASYILKNELEKMGIGSLVEPENTSDILKSKGLHYRNSYKISRGLLEDRKEEYETLEYFIDFHRDSVDKSKSTIEINGEKYAKILFVLGLENKNYKENLVLINKINDYLNENYPGLSRGIYKKKGKKVNGVYNQDFSSNTILIEFGGVGNTIDEVSNSIKAIANSLNYCITEEKTKNK